MEKHGRAPEEPKTSIRESPAANLHQQQDHYLGKQFKRIRVLGEGSFGVASVNRRRADHSLVVLKEVDLSRFKGEGEKQSAINEARIMSTLNHPNIIKYHNAYTSETKLVIEMEYASIGTLAAFLSFQVEPLDEQEVLIIFRQITSGLSYLHSRNIIHLDLKMTNIFVTIEGFIKIGDFGIARYLNSHQNQTGISGGGNHLPKIANSQLGTLAYSSPERCVGRETSFKSDIWSLGCILYELITSKPLFDAESLSELLLSITRIQYRPIKRVLTGGLKETFEQMIAREPAERPSAESLLLIIDQLSQRIQQHKLHQKSVLSTRTSNQHKKRQHRFDISTDIGQFHQPAQVTGNNDVDNNNALSSQLNYPHSFVYQVCLGSTNIHLDRVNLPATKRIKEMAKGQSHYLVLTYDNIVYGWGTKSYGQLGSCGYSSSSSTAASAVLAAAVASGKTQANSRRGTRSARSSLNARDVHLFEHSFDQLSSQSPSLASSTQTIIANNPAPISHSRQLIEKALAESRAAARPFVINELNNRKIIQVAAGNNFSVFLSKTGIVMTCGDGSKGCLGRGDLKSTFTPCMVESLLNTDVVSIASGPEHVVAVCGNGRAFAWGRNRHGRLGIATSSFRQTTKFVTRPQQVQFGFGNAGGEQTSDDDDQERIVIKRVFCGDRSSVFIDSLGRCWACGDNKFNKLGLDSRRRLKKTIVVDRSWFPVQISALGKYKIITCNIGKNHSTFLTNEGKIIVSGQDIDHTYRLMENIISGRASQRRISHELHPGPCSLGSRKNLIIKPQNNSNEINLSTISSKQQQSGHFRPIKSYNQLARSLIAHNKLGSFKQSSESLHLQSNSQPEPKCKLNRKQRQQIELFVRKSRSMKKMPFDCVIGVSCRPKFSLALSNDNRVYFWGTRSYRKSDEEMRSMLLQAGCASGEQLMCAPTELAGEQQRKSVEPQLVANCSDECFIKIGATNSSLMSSIQLLGSDQPIIHAQDPQLRAKSLADLWILDYRPSSAGWHSSSSSSCSSSGSSRSSLAHNHSCCSLSSCCSSGSSSYSCSSCTQCNDLNKHSSSPFRADDFLKHDAILEPQPIVSLYVPSMYNHNGSSLNLVDLFCFDEDRFYLILDTTVKLPQHLHSQQAANNFAKSPTTNHSTPQSKSRVRLNSFAGSIAGNVKNASCLSTDRTQQVVRQKSVPMERQLECDETIKCSYFNKNKQPVGLESKQLAETVDGFLSNGQELHMATSAIDEAQPWQNGTDRAKGCNSSDDNNNISSGEVKTSLAEEALHCSSHCGASIEEPRSLSTFAASQIILSPTMRTTEADSLKPLDFTNDGVESSQPELSDVTMMVSINTEDCLGAEGEEGGTGSKSIAQVVWQNELQVDRQQQRRSRRRRTRQRLSINKSESTTFTGNDLDNETSSMPSWVRNEFNQQVMGNQDSRSVSSPSAAQQSPDGLFRIDSSATEDTYMSELSLTVSEVTLASYDDETDNDLQSVIENAAANDTDRNEEVEVGVAPTETPNAAPVDESVRDSPRRAMLFSSRSEVDVRKHLYQEVSARKGSIDCQDVSFKEPRNILECSIYKTTTANPDGVEPLVLSSSQESLKNNNQLQLDSNLSSRCNSNNPLIQASPLIGFKRLNDDTLASADNRKSAAAASESLDWSIQRTEFSHSACPNQHSTQSTTTNTTVINPVKRPLPIRNQLSKSEVHLFHDHRLQQACRPGGKQETGGSSTSLAALRNSFIGRLFC